ncbi:MAG TPA: VWA-like domain-containing protein [Phycisphaerae bacterium]|nr:VWA-like domain-containing protein [Phycisphaerae bacterium]
MPTTKAPARDRLIKARTQMLWQAPFFAHRALHLELAEAPGLPTAATEGKHLWYNPTWIQEQTDSALKGLWVHEVLHIVNEHQRRRAERSPDDWNKAADLAIYHDTIDSGFELPDNDAPADLLAAARGKSAEQLYSLLRQQPSDEEQQPDPDAEQTPQDGAGPQDDSEEGQPDQDDTKQDEEQTPDNDGSGESDDQDGPQDADDETQGQDDQDGADSPADDAADGPSSPQDTDAPGEEQPDQHGPPEEAPDPYGMGAVLDAPDDSPAARAEEQQLILQAAHAARGQGFMPAGVKLLIEELEHPPLDWRTILAEFVDRTARNDWDRTRPNPRYAHTGFCMPSLRSERLTIALAVDTSGSCMDPQTQGRFAEELDAVLSFPDLALTVLYCDAQVHRIDHLAPEDRPWRPDKTPGGGGTDFRPVFAALDADPDGPPAALIYLTDLYGSFPDQAPDYPTLWVCTTDEIAPFGDTLRMQEA